VTPFEVANGLDLPPDYLNTFPTPKVFVQSTNDQYGPRAELEAMFETFAPPKAIHFLDAADHFFVGALEELEEIVAAEGARLVEGS